MLNGMADTNISDEFFSRTNLTNYHEGCRTSKDDDVS